MDISLPNMRAAQAALDGVTLRTPVLPMTSDRWRDLLPPVSACHVKLELFQQAGSFKARGAYLGIAGLDADARKAGVVAASGGNHAMAVAWAARAAGVSAKIAVPKAADPLRVAECRNYGADVVLCDDIHHAFAVMEESGKEEGRFMMHPFEAAHMALGAATCGLEFAEQCPQADVFVIPVGGGGLISGMAAAIKQVRPDAMVYGVEPEGADSMARSLAAGEPVKLEKVETIADSLGSPLAMPLSFGLAQRFVDAVVRVSDDDLRDNMRCYFNVLRIVTEPACAAALAAIRGPLQEKVAGRLVAILACGSNISLERYQALLGEKAP